MRTAKRILLLLILVSASTAFGVAIERDKFFPYYRVLEFYERNMAKAEKALGIGEKELTKPSPPKADFEIATREIPSSLLPLTLSGVQLNADLPIAAGGGGIAVIGDQVVIGDRLDRFFIYNRQKNIARKAKYPPLPSFREEFFSWGKFGRSELFRLHDVEFAETGSKGYLIASHETFDGEVQSTRLAVHRLEIDPDTLSAIGGWELVFQTRPLPLGDDYFAHGGGGRLAVYGDFVYLTIGDYNHDGVFLPMSPADPSQAETSDLRWIVRLNIETGARENISFGHRNPQGLTITPNGMVLSTEHGPRGGDELNIIVRGRNYGWPHVSLGVDYPAYAWPNNKSQGRHEGYEAPVFAWVPSVGVSNLIDIENFSERWDGDLLVGSLKAASLYRLRLNGEKITYGEPIWIGQRIRDLAQLPDGTIVLWTDQTQLLFLTIDSEQLADNKFGGVPVFSTKLDKCFQCHHLGPTNPSHPAPSLSNIVGRKVASDKQFDKYSTAMKELGGVWSRKRLTMFLTDPAGFAPGNAMAMEPESDLRHVRKLIDDLELAN